MGFKSFFSKNKKGYSSDNQQSNGVYPAEREAFVDYLLGKGLYDLALYQIVKYYSQCAPLGEAIDKITTSFTVIKPKICNTKDNVFIDHPVLDLLKNPNASSSYREFIEQIVGLYLLTGESYFISTGDTNRPPLEIFFSYPQNVTIQAASDGYIGSIETNSAYKSETYRRNEINNRWRYYNKNNNQEIYQSKRFNADANIGHLRGKSSIQSIYYEIEQYINSGIHNLSTLKRGAAPSAILTLEGEQLFSLSDDQRESLKQEINSFYAGAENAGRIGILDRPFKLQTLGQSNTDMDFLNLKKDTQKTIYSRLGVPLALISEETMTMANLANAKIMFYTETILPLADRIFEELTSLLMYRYNDSENLIITYDQKDIPALAQLRMDELTSLNKLYITSVNEQRAIIGFDKIDGGNEIYAPSTLIPITDENTDQQDSTNKTSKSAFVALMRQQINSDGSRKYDDTEIERLANKHGLTD